MQLQARIIRRLDGAESYEDQETGDFVIPIQPEVREIIERELDAMKRKTTDNLALVLTILGFKKKQGGKK